MNKVIIVGRLVKDPEVKTTQSQIAVCSFTVAVDRKFKTASGEKEADFISCVAWRQQAEFLGKYFQKGSRLGLTGSLQSRTYDDANGKKVYVTEVVIEDIEFVESKGGDGQGQSRQNYPAQTENNTAPASQTSNYKSAPKNNPPVPSLDNGFYPAMDDDTTLPFDL